MPPISLQERHLATCFCILFDPAPLNDSCPLPASHLTYYFVLWLKDQTHPWQKSRRTLLENWCQRGRERSHQSLSLSKGEREYHSHRGRKRSPGGENTKGESISQGSQMLGVQEERFHMSSWGEKTCSYVLIFISFVHLFLWALSFCSLSSPSIPC